MAGGGSNLTDQDEGLNDINIVPFVDIALVLLIIFMVTTEFIRQEEEEIQKSLPKNVPIELPRAASSEDTNKSLISIALTADGSLYMDGERSSLEAVRRRVEDLKQRGVKLEAFVAADQRLTHGAVLTVVDELRLLGVTDVGINTKPMEIE
jgi:biopolymer transport protein ExbD